MLCTGVGSGSVSCAGAGFSLCYVQALVCVVCGPSLVLCVGLSMCYVQALGCVMRRLQYLLCVGPSACRGFSTPIISKLGLSLFLGGPRSLNTGGALDPFNH